MIFLNSIKTSFFLEGTSEESYLRVFRASELNLTRLYAQESLLDVFREPYKCWRVNWGWPRAKQVLNLCTISLTPKAILLHQETTLLITLLDTQYNLIMGYILMIDNISKQVIWMFDIGFHSVLWYFWLICNSHLICILKGL